MAAGGGVGGAGWRALTCWVAAVLLPAYYLASSFLLRQNFGDSEIVMAGDELLRIYTPEGEPTDTYKRRDEVHRDGDWHGTVHLWVINSAAELLFQKRSNSAELHPGLWDVSAAGHIVSDDSIEMSLAREAHEELGISIAASDAIWLFTLKTETHSRALHERVFQSIYLINMDISLPELKPQLAEVAAVAWHHYSLLASLSRDSTGFVPRADEYARLLAYLEKRGMPPNGTASQGKGA